MDKDIPASEYKTPSLITPLCRRLRRWLAEIQLDQPEEELLPSLKQDLDDALELTAKAGIEPELVIFVMASCSWWFRVSYAKEAELRKVLECQLARVDHFPRFLRASLRSTVLDRYVSTQLSRRWNRGPSYDEPDSGYSVVFQLEHWQVGSLGCRCIGSPIRPSGSEE